MTNILQINVDRRRVTHDTLSQTAVKEEADLIVISEPNKSLLKRQSWYADKLGNAAIVNNSNLRVNEWGSGRGFAWIRTKDLLYIVFIYRPTPLMKIMRLF